MQARDYVSGRRYGLDWLRIAAFGLLILYHIGMFFVPWEWHVQTAEPLAWSALPLLALNPWRLALLFLISGIASRTMLGKLRTRSAFARDRSIRLLVPLMAGMLLFVAPQAWVELREKTAYSAGFWTFWIADYFEFGASRGLVLPTWNHLWFVAYLWAYTMVLAILAMAAPTWRRSAQRAFDRLFGSWRLVALPILWLFAGRMLLQPVFGETHALIDDPYAHSVYAFAFFFGVGLAASQAIWERIVAWWKPAGVAAILAYSCFAFSYAAYDILPAAGTPPPFSLELSRLARSIQGWCAILTLLGAAQLYLHHDGPVRRYLTDAVFPYYIAHQTIIVLAAYWLKPLHLGAGVEFLVLLLTTITGCALAHEMARRSGWARPLFGLKPLAQHSTSSRSASPGPECRTGTIPPVDESRSS